MQTVIVTGGSRGIGAAIVKSYAARGDKVYFLYEKDHTAAAKVREETGATAICCDVADWEKVEVIVEQEEKLIAPVRKDQEVGKIEVRLEGDVVKHFNIVCTESVGKKTFRDSLLYVWYLFLFH